jgi:proton-translocating NADH-quinone oxidoreductase chain M
VIPYALSLLIAVPLIGAFTTLLWPGSGRQAKWIALGFSLAELAYGLFVLLDFVSIGGFNLQLFHFAYTESAPWVPSLGISYTLGIDGLSFAMILLTLIIFPPAILFAFSEHEELHKFFAMLLAMEAAILGVFMAEDFFLFYIFWEAVLIPMFFLIHGWGGENRRYAAMKFFIYTHVASVVMLVGFLAMYFQYGSATGASAYTFDMATVGNYLSHHAEMKAFQSLAFILVFFGFAVKMPSFPFHTWLPDAHVQAPTAGSVILAALLLKMGGYGLIRIAVVMLPEGAHAFVPLMIFLGVASMVYGAFVCLRADDLKRLIAVSSVSHMGFVMIAVASLNNIGIAAAIFQMFAHGLISAMLFMMAGAIGHNVGTRRVSELGGINAKVPRIGMFTMFAFLASLGLPALVGFAAEFTVFLSFNAAFGYLVAIPLVTVLVTAAYYLWASQRALFGPLNPKFEKADIPDLKPFETVSLTALAALIVLFGILPFLLMDYVIPFATQVASALGGGML